MTTHSHPYSPPPPGHVDGPNACTGCGYGPAAPQHATTTGPASVATAREVANLWLAALDGLGGNAEAWGSVALRAVLAALDGETDLDRLGLSGIRMRVTPDGLRPYTPTDGDQPPLPLAA